MRYRLLKAKEIPDLEQAVNTALENGFWICGAPFVLPDAHGFHSYCQAVWIPHRERGGVMASETPGRPSPAMR